MRFENLHKTYGSRMVLQIPCLEISEGTRLAVMGPNGSGKSTMLKILAGVLKNDGEKISLSGCGYLPQKSYAFDMTVIKNAESALWDLPRSKRREKAENALRETGMLSLSEAQGKTLSGGEMQRLALARVLGREPKILLLDEPTAACDIESENLIESALSKWNGTLIFSTHSPAQAMRLGDKAIFLEKGKILEFGSPEEVIMNPKSERVREYMSHWRIEYAQGNNDV